MAGLLALPPRTRRRAQHGRRRLRSDGGLEPFGQGDAVMLGTGSALERAYYPPLTPDERAALGGPQFRRARSLTAIVGP